MRKISKEELVNLIMDKQRKRKRKLHEDLACYSTDRKKRIIKACKKNMY